MLNDQMLAHTSYCQYEKTFPEKISKHCRHELDFRSLMRVQSFDLVKMNFELKEPILCLKNPGKQQNAATSQINMF